MKRIARLLRRTADRIDPAGQNPIVRLEVNWKRTEPPHIDLELIGGNRMCGYVVPRDPNAPRRPVQVTIG